MRRRQPGLGILAEEAQPGPAAKKTKAKAKRKDPDAKLAAQAAPILKKPAAKRSAAEKNIIRWRFLKQEPSLISTKEKSLASRRVRTHPETVLALLSALARGRAGVRQQRRRLSAVAGSCGAVR